MSSTSQIDVAVAAPLHSKLSYALGNLDLQIGQSVRVPLGKRRVDGVVWRKHSDPAPFEVKNVIEPVADNPILSEPYLRWLEWMSHYYFYPLGLITQLMFPPSKRVGRKKTKLEISQSMVDRPNFKLTSNQARIVEDIRSSAGFQTHLLFGVTGSGKTEIYMTLLEHVVASGQQGLLLVPEISLTPQLMDRFSRRFPNELAISHSQLSHRERTDQYWRVVTGQAKILIGARSALFCPIPNLRLIILDEEHEGSFKQDEKFRYHARDAAIVLAQQLNCPIVLGSATPSLESWHNAQTGRFRLHQLSARANNRPLPTMEVVSLKPDQHGISHPSPSSLPWLTPQLDIALEQTLARGEQAALFLNRRGLSPMAFCGSCGYVPECPNCSVSLTVHQYGHLVCHYCDFSMRSLESCPQCRHHEVAPIGLGTERVEMEMKKRFPKARIRRADRDEIQSRHEMQDLIREMEHGEIDVLIGTQMIAKGLDFHRLTLVGLLLADIGFNMPDFRAAERSFQLMTQMGGRSGRHSEHAGRVIIQALNPHHSAVQHALQHDYVGFAQTELKLRKELGYPPFGRVVLLRTLGPTLASSCKAIELLAHRAATLRQMRKEFEPIRILGPAPSPLVKIRNLFRHQMLLKIPSATLLTHFIHRLLGDQKWLPHKTRLQVDVDPQQML